MVRSEAPGSPDERLLERAAAERRILVTLDTDFGQLALLTDLPPETGVILVRLPTTRPRSRALIAQIIDEYDEWAGHLAVVGPGRIRIIRLQAI